MNNNEKGIDRMREKMVDQFKTKKKNKKNRKGI